MAFSSSRALTTHIRQQPLCEAMYGRFHQGSLRQPEHHAPPPNPPATAEDNTSDDEDTHDTNSSSESTTDSNNDFPLLDDTSISHVEPSSPAQTITPSPQPPPEYHNGIEDPPQIPYLIHEQVEAALLQIMKEMKAPLHFYQRILSWACEAHRNKYHFMPERTTYHQQVDYFEKKYGMKSLRPQREPVIMEGPALTSTVVYFDFITSLKAIFEDPFINRDENLLVNPDDHFTPYVPPDGLLGEAITGSWYRHACDTMIKDPNKDFVLPIGTASDAVHITDSGTYSSHPVVFFPMILKRQIRNHPRTSRLLRYLPQPYVKRNLAQPSGKAKGSATRNLHQCLSVIFRSFSRAQIDDSLKNFNLRLGSQKKVVNLLIPHMFMICDTQGADYFCARPAYYGCHAVRINRACDATPDNCCDPSLRCNRIKQYQMQRIHNAYKDHPPKEKSRIFKKAYMVDCHNAFWDLNLGNCPYGIYSQCVSETLHQVENGILLQCLKQLFEAEFGTVLCGKIDNVAQWLSLQPRHRGEQQFGRIRFQHGLTQLTNTTASEKTMIATALVMILCTHDGKAAMASKYKKKIPTNATT
jgi:Plavaka transposase